MLYDLAKRRRCARESFVPMKALLDAVDIQLELEATKGDPVDTSYRN